MAQRGQKDLLGRLADAGEEAWTRLSQTPGLDRFMGVMTNMRDQVDALGTRVRGLEGLENRVENLEREVRKLSQASGGSTARSSSPARKTSGSTARKTSSSTSSRKTSGSTRKK